MAPWLVELTAPVICPAALVVPLGWVMVTHAGGLALSDTVRPGTGLLKASRTLTVIVLVPLVTSMLDGLADTSDCERL